MRPARIVTLGSPQSQEVCSGGPGSPTYSSSMNSRPRPSRATWDRVMEVCTTVWRRRGEGEEGRAEPPQGPLDPILKSHPGAPSRGKAQPLPFPLLRARV